MRSSKTMDLTRGSVMKQMLLFALPIMLGNLLQQLYNVADRIVVGQFAPNGEVALAAVGATSSAIFLVLGLFNGMAVGVDVNYSLSRGLGSLAYAISCVVLGRMSAAIGVENVLPVNMGFLLALIAAALMFPTAPMLIAGQKGSGEQPHSVWYILKNNPPFALMMVAVLFCMTAMMPIENFMYNIVEGNGGDETHLGLALFIVGAAELPSAFIFTKLKPRMKVQTMMALAMIFVLFKSACMLIPVLSVILLVQLLQMFGYGLFLPSSVYYVNENVPVVDRVRGQAIMMMASTGLGGVFGNVIAGRVIDLGGVHALIVFCVICGVIGSALAVAALIWTGKRTAMQGTAGKGAV